jgi:phage FluMu gp28-like protein
VEQSAILYPYQRQYIDDASRFKIAMFARQTGKTFTSTLEIAADLVACELAKKRTRWVILSRGERQAKEAMDEGLKLHLRAMGAAFEAYESEFRLADNTTVKALEVVGKHGGRVTALPASPDTARGFSANVFLDEFAFHADSRKIWQALFPVISKPGLRLRVVSTPNGKGNKFYELMTDEKGAWSKHVVDIYRAVADGLPRDIDELRAGCGDEDTWAQEYELQWLDEASAWLPWDMINAVEHDHAGLPEHYAGGPVCVGVDIGRRNDLFVIWVLELVGDVLWTREIIARRRVSFAEQDDLLDGVFRRYNVMRCCMDQTGMGEKPVEDAQRRHGTSRVEGVLFTGANKLTLATVGKEAFEDRRIRIPLGDRPLREDLHKLQKTSSPTGAPRFVAESDASGHADRAWACFLACNAAAEPAAPIECLTARNERSALEPEAESLRRLPENDAGFRSALKDVTL